MFNTLYNIISDLYLSSKIVLLNNSVQYTSPRFPENYDWVDRRFTTFWAVSIKSKLSNVIFLESLQF